jgi:dienelactone hydrolase
VYFRAEAGGTVVGSASLFRYGRERGITEIAVGDNGLAGVFYAPLGNATRGAVIAFGGSEGGLSTGKYMAAHFASLGYPALGLAYFGASGLPASLSGVPLEYFQRAHDWLVTRKEVNPNEIAVWGYSRGGELALLLGATFPWVTAVVAGAPSGTLFGDDAYGDGSYNTAAWWYGGNALPFLPFTDANAPPLVTLADGSRATSVAPFYLDAVKGASSALLASATIPIERAHGPILIASGASDEMWPGCALAQIAIDRLNAAGHVAGHHDQLTCYPGAGHSVAALPGAPTWSQLSASFSGGAMALGGDPASIAHAQRDFDTKVRALLEESLK